MRRITLSGNDLSDFPDNMSGGYIKLIFSREGNYKPNLRTYTIAQQRHDNNEIDIDFMLHGDSGLAASWANNAKVGDSIEIAGGSPKTGMNHNADWFLIAGDMTALPAICVNLRSLPENAKGFIYIEILSEADKRSIEKPINMEIIWVVNPKPGSDETPLANAINQCTWLSGEVSAWAACEFKTMKKIRQFLKIDHALPKERLYISSYWKNGLIEEEHKLVKREDTIEFAEK